ncbi:MAG: hypothetical protein EF807_05630 [Candidatus Methanolliviera hydrocarbonicum]|uniref:Formylmethanofuran: tetrahydromethanopterin formyltransferase Ftr C-terminal domain-containing protein n=1 Tax=Candidatus Methanolliviera hydrocarbonicum TaxID=2491085 RepID=A0A520KW18_9EURY|nr:MAG: hypothetical protein EF807_05630 [Candidatus Methanolliviera hydrocarbonicum]
MKILTFSSVSERRIACVLRYRCSNEDSGRLMISAGNYGGKLGKYKINLGELL